MLEKTERMNELLDQYSSLLTERQKEIADLYYQSDLSLAEIKEELGISRAAVHDLLRRTELILEDYESKLRLAEKNRERCDLLDRMAKDDDQKVRGFAEEFALIEDEENGGH